MTDVLLTLFLGIPVEGGGPHPRFGYVSDRLEKDLAFAHDALGKSPYFAGKDLTGADINMTMFFKSVRDYLKRDLAPYPNIVAYLSRIEARPAYKKAQSLA